MGVVGLVLHYEPLQGFPPALELFDELPGVHPILRTPAQLLLDPAEQLVGTLEELPLLAGEQHSVSARTSHGEFPGQTRLLHKDRGPRGLTCCVFFCTAV